VRQHEAAAILKEVRMKKLLVLAGVAALAFGARKLFSAKEDEASEPYGANGYVPQPQG
jgi:hypothetical protein